MVVKKTSANIATYPPRLESLKRTIASLYEQVDVIRIYFNEYESFPKLSDPDCKIIRMRGDNLTDNGKFAGLELVKDHEYYFTMDDDLIFPPDYVERTVEAIERYGCIVTYHGRGLTGRDLNYYQGGHDCYRCMDAVKANFPIDVAGTGCTAWDTKYFHPRRLQYHALKRMSDLIFSLAVAERRKTIGVIAHEANWIKHIEHKETIYETEVNKDQVFQIELANKIYDLKYGNRDN